MIWKVLIAIATLLSAVMLVNCSTMPETNLQNVCHIFDQKPRWYHAMKQSAQRWGIPIEVNMAIFYQESRFRARAKPPRRKLFGFIPRSRPSTAFGYSQALDATWARYQKETNSPFAKRYRFDDAADFAGWYNNMTVKMARVSATNARALYLAYHEGQRGYLKGSYKKKAWLKKVAYRVHQLSITYKKQLAVCAADFDKPWWRRL